MKKFFLVICFSCLMFASGFGQKGLHLGFRFTPHATMVLDSSMFADPQMDPRPTFGYNYGFSFGYHFNDYVGLEMNLLYAVEGTRGIPQPENNTRKDEFYKAKLNFVKIPILFAFNSNPMKRVSFSGNLGLSLNIFTDGKYTEKFARNGYIESELDLSAPELKTFFQPVVLGAVLGLGVKVKVVESIYLDGMLRMEADVTNLLKKKIDDWVIPNSGYTRCAAVGFSLGLTYVFDAGK